MTAAGRRTRATQLRIGTARAVRRTRRAIDNRAEPRRRVPWPMDAEAATGIALVVVNFNTAGLLSQLLFSLHRVLDPGEFSAVVVVDNGSSDDSPALLAALADAGVVTQVVSNRRAPYHGPGLNRGVSFLAANQHDARLACRWVAVVDSDVVALRPGGLGAAQRQMESEGAVVAGPPRPIGMLPEYLHVSLNVLDPRVVWQPGFPPFQEDGHPGAVMQRSLLAAGLKTLRFPFYEEEYFLHLGRGTVRELHDRGIRSARYPDWAQPAYNAHFEGHRRGAALHSAFLERFRDEVPQGDPAVLVEACLRPERLRFA